MGTTTPVQRAPTATLFLISARKASCCRAVAPGPSSLAAAGRSLPSGCRSTARWDDPGAAAPDHLAQLQPHAARQGEAPRRTGFRLRRGRRGGGGGPRGAELGLDLDLRRECDPVHLAELTEVHAVRVDLRGELGHAQPARRGQARQVRRRRARHAWL